MGRTKLFRFLRDEGVLMHDNEPHQQYIDSGYFKVVTKDLPYYGGRYLSPKFVTLVSSKGIDFIKDLIKKQEGSNGKN